MSLFNTFSATAAAAKRSISTLRDDIGGFAAVEFAMIVPVMMIMLLGSVEVSDALTVDGRINVTAASISDIIARSTPLTKSELRDIFKIGHVLIGKYPVQNLRSEVVSLQPNAAGSMRVVWSFDSNGNSPYTAGSVYPGNWDGMVQAPNSLIVTKSTFDYMSPVGQYIHNPIVLSHVSNNVSRVSAVICSDC
jgi:Flp pilus assembly protein TadG